MRRRPTALLSAALAVSLGVLASVAPLATRAADTPEGAANAVIDTIIAKDFAALGPLVCEEKREEILAEVDLAAEFASSGVDPQQLIDAMTLTVDDRLVSLVSEEGDSAVVQLSGTLRITIEETAAREWVKLALEAAGQPADDASVDLFVAFLFGTLAEGLDIDAKAEVVRVDGQWLMCDGFTEDEPVESFEPDASFPPLGSFDPFASLPPVANPLCDLLTVEELNALGGVVFESADPVEDGCTYGTAYSADDPYVSLAIYLQTGQLSFLKDIWNEGEELTVAGKPAWGTETATWVELGPDRILAIQPIVLGAAEGDEIDVVELAAAIGEIIVPRME